MKFRHHFTLSEARPESHIYRSDGVSVRLDFFRNILRVAVLRDGCELLPTWSVCPGSSVCPLEGRDKLSTDGFVKEAPVTEEGNEEIRFELCGNRVSIERMNFRIRVENEKGLLYQDRDGLAYNFDHELGDGSVHFTRRFEGQKIFGLGDKCGKVDKSGRSFELGACDSMGFRAESSDPLYKHLPFYICENSAGAYGLYYDTYSNGRVNFGEEHDNYYEPFNSVRYEEENLVFYLIFGTVPEILSRFCEMCGGTAGVPEWAFRYCGSTMSYTDARNSDEQLRGFTEKCAENGIRAGGFYLSSGYTSIGDKRYVFNWDRDKIPSPKGLSDHFRACGMELIPNVKPAFLTDHPMYGMIAGNGWFLHYADGSPAVFPFWGGMASYLDFTNSEAYGFWKDCVKEQLVSNGYTNIWNDNNEYDVWDRDVLAHGFGKELPARQIRPLFSLLMSRASREAVTEATGCRNPFVVSRCAVAGTQRYATTWTGDNLTDFRDLRYNHFQAMTMALSGFVFFGPDVGGFAGPKPGRELFLRWLQYGVFLPRFVLHSWKPGEEPTMPWLYPDLMDAVRRIFSLRERLIPYLREGMDRCIAAHRPLVYPVFLDYPGYDPESDVFMCGDSILACPVFDEGAQKICVYLPDDPEGWRLRGTGAPKSGVSVIVGCGPEDEPVWFIKGERKLP